MAARFEEMINPRIFAPINESSLFCSPILEPDLHDTQVEPSGFRDPQALGQAGARALGIDRF